PVPRGRRRLPGRVREWVDHESILGPVFVTPALLLLVLLVAYPFVMALYFSMSNAFIGRPSRWVGLHNFIALWDSDVFRQTFQNAFVFTSIAVAFKVVLGIILALLLNEQLWFKRVIRGAVLLPWVIPTALSTLGWWWMFNSLYSVVNWTGIALGIMDPPGPNWLGQRYYAMSAVIAVNVWRGLPFFAITILAGLVAIPKELYEAAEADGAGANARFWHVTPPLRQAADAPRRAAAVPDLRAVPLLSHDADVAEAGPRALRPLRGAARHHAGADARALREAPLGHRVPHVDEEQPDGDVSRHGDLRGRRHHRRLRAGAAQVLRRGELGHRHLRHLPGADLAPLPAAGAGRPVARPVRLEVGARPDVPHVPRPVLHVAADRLLPHGAE